MTDSGRHVVFDIVGTCVSYDAFFEAIEVRMGERFKPLGIKSSLFGYAWMEAAERENSYLDRMGRRAPVFGTFKPLFYRMLYMAGVQDPRNFATDQDADFLMASYRTLKARPGIHEGLAKLREGGFTVWALTSGDRQRVRGYLDSNGIDIPGANFMTCDDFGVTKPNPEVYKRVLGRFEGAKDVWFAAAHMWDSAAAKQSGFKAAWCSVLEKEPATEIFGEVDVVADSFVEMAEKIIAASC